MTTPHPRIRERRAEVEDQTQRSRQRKLIALAILVVGVVLAGAATQSPLLDVDEVRVVGAQRTSTEFFRQAAGVELGTPLLGLDTTAIEERLIALPEVGSVTAASNWRGIVTVEITERLPVARIESADGTVVVAADGLVLEIIGRVAPTVDQETSDESSTSDPSTSDPGTGDPSLDTGPSDAADQADVGEPAPLPAEIESLPEIAGAMFSTERGKQIPDVLNDALQVATALPPDIYAITERIEITVDSLVLKAVGGGEISLGDARDLQEKFDAVRAFLAQVDLSCLDTLNVRAPSVPVIRRTPNC